MTSILVVDNDHALCRAIAETLIRAGYDTHMVFDGHDALRKVEDEAVDIVVTDIFMPECDGLEVITSLNRNFPAIRIVAMSGQEPGSGMDYLNTAKTFGAATVLSKPFRSAELLSAIDRCLVANPADGVP